MSLLKKFAAMAMVAVMAVGMTACGGGDDAADTKTYVIATDTTFAPFEFQNDAGEYVGVDMDLLAAIAEDQGLNMTCSIWALMRLYRHWNPVRLTVLSQVCPSHPKDRRNSTSPILISTAALLWVSQNPITILNPMKT